MALYGKNHPGADAFDRGAELSTRPQMGFSIGGLSPGHQGRELEVSMAPPLACLSWDVQALRATCRNQAVLNNLKKDVA